VSDTKAQAETHMHVQITTQSLAVISKPRMHIVQSAVKI
jgi:hypothetical protein